MYKIREIAFGGGKKLHCPQMVETNTDNHETDVYKRQLYSLSNKMDNSLLAVRDINHKYIVVEGR